MAFNSFEDVPGDGWLVRLRPRAHFIYTTQSRTVLATDLQANISGNADEGLWVFQTRMLSKYRWLVNGVAPELVVNSNVLQHTWLGYYIVSPPGIRDEGHDETNPAQQTVELRLSRSIADGMCEHVAVTNFTQKPISLDLELEIDADFADHAETRGERTQKGALERRWKNGAAPELVFDYTVEHAWHHQSDRGVARMHRSMTARIDECDSPPTYSGGRIAFNLEIQPHREWHACLTLTPMIYDLPLPGVGVDNFEPVVHRCQPRNSRTRWDDKREQFLESATQFSAPQYSALAPVVIRALKQARGDMASLRMYDLDCDQGWVPGAGVPVYVALFGRDSLAASWESSLTGSEMMRGALSALPKWQGDRFDNWLDEQPGKIPHEAHTGPLSVLKYGPHGLYYGGVTGSIYYPTVVSALWHWTGEKDAVRPFVEPALRGLRWADSYGDINGDGFYEYETRSSQGEKNQGWKDSGDAIVYEDGSLVQDPLGTCEMQAFVYASKMFFSETLWWLDMPDEALRLFRQAEELKKRFNEAFWVDDLNYVAMALDGRGHQVRSVASDPGHCLTSGILDESRVRHVAERLMAPDMFSGWGVRTLSAEHPAFNPYAYHRGTIWPVENAVFALGFARYGMHDLVNKLCKAQFEAAALFDYCRLPECFAGHQRDADHPFPAMYSKANWPQAWSSSAVFSLLQSMLGIYPYAPLNTLLVDPWLPEWLPEITVEHLRVGQAVASISFHRNDDGSSDYEVLDVAGDLHILRQPSPWSLTSGFGERVKDAVESLLPGR
jgi:glycogen debranching enzyme